MNALLPMDGIANLPAPRYEDHRIHICMFYCFLYPERRHREI